MKGKTMSAEQYKMRQLLSTKEKCILRDLIKIELKSLDKDDYGKYKYFFFS